ncbi:MAG TPA: hypothetical protein GX513_07790 [Firmicutes bacterium]|nr:hypothetical protein [Bacillota bacterium]
MEEAGELAEAIGKLRGMNGEQVETEGHHVYQLVARELLDVAQTAVTMMFVLEEQHGVDIERAMVEHLEKLLAKGYLTVYGGGRVAGMAGVFPGVGALPGADTAGEEGGPTCRGGSQA